MATVNFAAPTDYTTEAEQIARQRKLAESLQEQGSQPLNGQMAGRFYVAPSWTQGLAKLAQSLSGAYSEKQADERQKSLVDKFRTQGVSDATSFMSALSGTPASSETIMDETANGGEGQQAQINAPAVAPDRKRALAIALQSQNPMVQGAGSAMLAQQLKADDPYNLREGEKRYGPGGKVIASNDKAPQPFTLTPGATRYGADNKPVAAAPKEDELARALEAAGIPLDSPSAQALFKERALKLATHAPPTRVNVAQNVSTEKKYGEKFAGEIAAADSAMRDAAIKAPQLAERANQVKQLLNSGNAITGLGADFRLGLNKALALAGVKGADGAATTTEQLSVGLAQNTLDAIKASGLGSGSGFSNADRDFLEKAVGGKITLEKGTIDRLANLAHKAAEQTALRWSTRVKEIPASALEGTGIKPDPIAVPPLFGGSAKWSVVK